MRGIVEDLPPGWEAPRLRMVGQLEGGAGFPHAAQGQSGEELPFFKVADMALSADARALRVSNHTVSHATARSLGAQVISPGAVVFAKVGAALLLNRRRVTSVPCCIDNNMMAFLPTFEPTWAFYALSIVDLGSVANPGAVPSVSERQVGAVRIPLPPLPTQRAIAAYLDRETARIDTLIEKKERLLELLEEKRTALITQAVTKGLDPDVPMKDSGVEWLGEVPAHWEVVRLAWLCRPGRPIIYGIVLPGPNVDGGVPLVKGGDVAAGRLDPGYWNRVDTELEARHSRSRLLPNDLVYSIRGSYGEVEVVPESLSGANITQDAARISPRHEFEPRWLAFTLSAQPLQASISAGTLGATIKGVNIRDLRRLWVPVPPCEERRQIQDYLASEGVAITAVETRITRAITLLREYRSALISAAVTGQIEVPELNDEEAA